MSDSPYETTPGLVIAIDGPAGAGKSTVSKLLAERLGFEFLDTGAMYRCVTLAVLRAGISLSNSKRIAELASKLQIEIRGSHVTLDGEDVSDEIRTPKVASAIGLVADNIEVRSTLTKLQREWTQGKKVVTEGRDQGSEVFPDSPCKVFLSASPEERAQRRFAELTARGIETKLEQVLAQQIQRDADDRARPVGALRKAEDAVEICTDGLSLESVVSRLAELVHAHLVQRPTEKPSSAAQESRSGQST